MQIKTLMIATALAAALAAGPAAAGQLGGSSSGSASSASGSASSNASGPLGDTTTTRNADGTWSGSTGSVGMENSVRIGGDTTGITDEERRTQRNNFDSNVISPEDNPANSTNPVETTRNPATQRILNRIPDRQ